MTKKPDKIRVSVTMTKVYFDILEPLVSEGFILDMREGVRVAPRLLFRHHGYEFKIEEAEE